jgi:ketosteroid isomerase-like protein
MNPALRRRASLPVLLPVFLRIEARAGRAIAFADRGQTGGRRSMTVESLNRQRVLHLVDCFARGDVEGALACCTDDVDFLTHAPIDLLPQMAPRHGKHELRAFWQSVRSSYSETRYDAPRIVAEGDQVATYVQTYFKKRGNGRVVRFDMAVFYTLRGGLVAQIREIIDSYDLVQQVLEREIGPLIAAEGIDGV